MRRPLIKDNLKILDSLRGFAAIYVLIHHARWILWEGFQEGYSLHPEKYSFFNKMLMYFFSAFKFGNEAVIFFFILSGFVIHYSVSRRIDKDGKFIVSDYLIKRVRRIYPPLIIAIVLTFVLDSIGRKLNLPIYFSHTPYPAINENIQSDLSWKTLLGNLVFVQKIYTPVWGTDGPLWSLMYEWWFYMLYIPLIILFRKNKYVVSAAVVVIWWVNVTYGASMPLLLHSVLNLFIIWFSGLLLADVLLYTSIDIRLMPLFFLLIIVGAGASGNFPVLTAQVILSVIITIFLYLMLTTRLFDFLKRFEKLGAFSYSLYALHMPIVCIISGFVMKAHNGYLPSHFLYVVVAIIISIIISWFLHLIGEKPFTKK